MEIDRQTSNLLKGIAILLIVLTHAIRGFQIPFINFIGPAAIGVFLFLFLSGYGIGKSYGLAGIDTKKYLEKRFRRVVIPYWLVLTAYIIALCLWMPAYLSPVGLTGIALNYLMIEFSPFDILGVGWFVTYIMIMYLIYLAVSKLPLDDSKKILLMLVGIPAMVYFLSGTIVSVLTSTLPGVYTNVLYSSRALYLPYAFAFPLGVFASKNMNWKLSLNFKPLETVGNYSYWIYLVHMGILCALFIFGIVACADYCANWTEFQMENYIAASEQQFQAADYQAAIASADKAIALNPYYGTPYNCRAMAQFMLGNITGALADYDKAIEVEPAIVSTYMNRGNARMSMGKYAEAAADYDKALQLDSTDAHIYYARGMLRGIVENYTGAVKEFDEAINLKPDYELAYQYRAFAKYKLGDYAGTNADFSKAIEINPLNSETYGNRGILRLQLGDYTGAKADLDKSHALNPALPDYESAKAKQQ